MRAVPRLCELNPGICLSSEEKARKTLSQDSRRVQVGTMKYTTFKYAYQQQKECNVWLSIRRILNLRQDSSTPHGTVLLLCHSPAAFIGFLRQSKWCKQVALRAECLIDCRCRECHLHKQITRTLHTRRRQLFLIISNNWSDCT